LLFPAHEDFGIIPVEAQACGTPVLGLGRGGLLETVVEGETGFLIDAHDPGRYAAVLTRVDGLDHDRIVKHAWTFSADVFKARMTAWVDAATR
jgi:glycosyltransferase involved in cell wall biosynthesis